MRRNWRSGTFGQVVVVRNDMGRSRGFGFVEFQQDCLAGNHSTGDFAGFSALQVRNLMRKQPSCQRLRRLGLASQFKRGEERFAQGRFLTIRESDLRLPDLQ